MKTVRSKNVVVGADFAGFPLKEAVKRHLEERGWTVTDLTPVLEETPMYHRVGFSLGARTLVEGVRSVQAAHTVAETDQFHAVSADDRLSQPADGRVQAGGVAARCKNTDAFRIAHENLLVRPRAYSEAGFAAGH